MPTGGDPINSAQFCYAVRFAAPVRLARIRFHANAQDENGTGAPDDFDVLGWRGGQDDTVPDLLYATRRAPLVGTWSDGELHWSHSFYVAHGIVASAAYSVLLFEFRHAIGGSQLVWPGWSFEFYPLADLPVCATAEGVSAISQQDAQRLAEAAALRSAYGWFERKVTWIGRMAVMNAPVEVNCVGWPQQKTMMLRVAREYPDEPDNETESEVDSLMMQDLNYMIRLAEEDAVFCRVMP